MEVGTNGKKDSLCRNRGTSDMKQISMCKWDNMNINLK